MSNEENIKTPRRIRPPHSAETRKKMSESAKLRAPATAETREKMRQFHLGKQYRLGEHHTEATKQLMRDGWHKREKFLCEYCNKRFYKSQYVQWHGDKCPAKP